MATSERVKVRELAADWAGELNLDPMMLARAILIAAMDGEFVGLTPGQGVTLFDEKRLLHSPVGPAPGKTPPYQRFAVDMAIRSGWAWVHHSAILAFAERRGYRPPAQIDKAAGAELGDGGTRQTVEPETKGTRLVAAASALKELFPSGRLHHTRQTMANMVGEAIGETVSIKTLERAMKIAWPGASNSAKARQN